jgi:hypothetical protein
MSATANGFAHAFSTWIAGGNGLNSGKDGVMRYNSGPMRGMTRDAAQMKFQNEVWKNAAPEWKDEYAKRATTGMLAPSEQKQAATVPTVTPPMRAPAPVATGEGGSLMEQMEKDSQNAANKPMEGPPPPDSEGNPQDGNGYVYLRDGRGNADPKSKPHRLTDIQMSAGQTMESSAAAADRNRAGLQEALSPTPTVSPPIRPGGTSQPAFGNRPGTGASENSSMARSKGNGLATSQPAFGSRPGTGASQTGRVAQVKVGI